MGCNEYTRPGVPAAGFMTCLAGAAAGAGCAAAQAPTQARTALPVTASTLIPGAPEQ